jgi:hypothetical protein
MATSSGTLRPLSVHAMIRCRQSPVAQPITPTGLGSASIQRCLSFCRTDNMLMAPRIAEHLDIRLPVMVCLDGFVISHSIETMHIEDDQRVRGFIGGHRLCASCPVPIITKMLTRVTDYEIVVGSATGCLEVASSIFPYSAWKIPWMHTAFENAAASVSGMEAMYRVLKKKGKTDKKIKFVAIGGDGGTYDIGFQSLSAAMERGHDLLYICYDNGAYMKYRDSA